MTVLETARARVELRPDAGGRIGALTVDGVDLLVTQTPASSPLDWGCYPMAPWAGRIGHGRFAWRGHRYQLPANFGPHAIHGTTFHVAWDEEAPGVMSTALGPPWPWPGRVRHQAMLTDDDLTLRLEVTATEEPMPAVIGWHPWWRRGDLDLDLSRARMYERGSDHLPTGKLVDPGPGPWDDCFTGIGLPPVLHWPGQLTLAIETDNPCDHWVIYDEPADALCVEPQTGPPNAFNLGLGVATVSPGEPLVARVRFRWSRGTPPSRP